MKIEANADSKVDVVIIGGGIAGLTVAHELARSDRFNVTVFEQNDILGGKARSIRLDDGHYGEHAMRVYLASYSALYTIMSEIPFEAGFAIDNLRYGQIAFTANDRICVLESSYLSRFTLAKDIVKVLWFVNRCGVPFFELIAFVARIFRPIWLLPDELNQKMARLSFQEYLGGQSRSPAFQQIVLRICEMLIAAKRTASAAVNARLILEWFTGPLMTSRFRRSGFAHLNGPTNLRFVDPWVAYLKSKDVQFRTSTRILNLHESARMVDYVTIATDSSLPVADVVTGKKQSATQDVNADIFVCAVQHNILSALLTERMKSFMSDLSVLDDLSEEWSHGIQFFLRDTPPSLQQYRGRHSVPIESPWSIVCSIYDSMTWDNVPLPTGTVGILSVVLSNCHLPGLRIRKPYNRCTADELFEETLFQLGLADSDNACVIQGYVGPDLEYVPKSKFVQMEATFNGYAAAAVPDGHSVVVSDSLLYIRSPRDLDAEPENRTDIYNFFVAGEFTRTTYSTPTMEKACESGMRCAQSIYEKFNLPYDVSRYEPVQLPFPWLRTYRFRYSAAILSAILAIVVSIYLWWR